jgi:hypothetical protein
MKNVLITSVMLIGLAMGAQASPLVFDITSSGLSGPTEDNTLSDRIDESAAYSATLDTDLSTASKEVRDDGATLVYGFAATNHDGNAKLTLGSDMLNASDAFIFLRMA